MTKRTMKGAGARRGKNRGRAAKRRERRPLAEPLEKRLCLSGFYELDLVASTAGGAFSSFGDRVSINGGLDNDPRGNVAFVGNTASGGNSIYNDIGNGLHEVSSDFNDFRFLFPSSLSQNDVNLIAARDLITFLSPAQTRFRVWNGYSDNDETIVGRGAPGQPFSSVLARGDINNKGQVTFVGTEAGGLQWTIQRGTRNGEDSVFIAGVPTAGTFAPQPQLTDDGRVLYTNSFSNTLWLRPNGATGEKVASPDSGFTKVGTGPGITADGRYVVFRGDRGNGHGIFLAYGPTYNDVVRIAGEGLDGFTFTDDDLPDVVRINSTHLDRALLSENRRSMTVVFEGSHQSLGHGVYAAQVSVFDDEIEEVDFDDPLTVHVSGIVPVARVGEEVHPGVTIADVNLWEAVNDIGLGQIAFWAKMSDDSEEIFRASPRQYVWVDFDPTDNGFTGLSAQNFALLEEMGIDDAGWGGSFEDALRAQGSLADFDALQEDIVDDVQRLFDETGADITVLGRPGETPPPFVPYPVTDEAGAPKLDQDGNPITRGAFMTVLVGGAPGDPASVVNLGLAAPLYIGSDAPDYFNQVKDDTAVVFADSTLLAGYDEDDFFFLSDAEIVRAMSALIAHEAAHNYGLFHVLPVLSENAAVQVVNHVMISGIDSTSFDTAPTFLSPAEIPVHPHPELPLGITEDPAARLRFAAGQSDTFFNTPGAFDKAAPELLSVTGSGIRAQLNPLLNVGGITVSKMAAGVVPLGEEFFPVYHDLGGGSLELLLANTEIRAGAADTLMLLGSTDGQGVDIVAIPAANAGAENSIVPSLLGISSDGRLGAPLVEDQIAFRLFQLTDDGPVSIGVVGVSILPPEGEIRGIKWFDANGNGVQDASEPGLAGWTIFLDENGNQQLDQGEQSTVTGEDGGYAFTNLPKGTYTVEEFLEPGWRQTFPRLLVEFGDPLTVGGGFDALAAGHADADGDIDLFNVQGIANEEVIVHLNNGDGTFSNTPQVISLPAGDDARSLAVGDFDDDGDDDIAVGLYRIIDQQNDPVSGQLETIRGGAVRLLINTGGVFAPAPTTIDVNEIESMIVGDFDGDGDDDLALYTTYYNPLDNIDQGHSAYDLIDSEQVEVLINQGAAGLSAPIVSTVERVSTSLMAVGDFDDDGDDDLATGESPDVGPYFTTGIRILQSNGDGTFVNSTLSETNGVPTSVASGDFDGDGDDDLAASAQIVDSNYYVTPGVRVLLNTGGGAFDVVDVAAPSTFGILHSGDFSGNGRTDVVGHGLDGIKVFVNESDGVFTSAQVRGGEVLFREIAVDLNGDNLTDLADNPDDVRAHLNETTLGERVRHVIEVGRDEIVDGVNFGNVLTEAEIRGVKWFDANGDGFRDEDEPLLAGWTIFLDENGNETLDAGERFEVTDEQGRYAFSELAPGDYSIVEQAQTHWQPTFPFGPHEITLEPGELAADIDFGNEYVGPLSEIRGVKWNDLNQNGVRDGGEPGLFGWTIFLDENGNNVLDEGETSTVTNDAGQFAFTGLLPFEHRAAEVQQLGWVRTFPAAASHVVALQPGQTATVDFGNFLALPELMGEIRGVVWDDENGDGIHDPGEPGLAGRLLYLDSNRNGRQDENDPTALTNASGEYVFTLVPPGEHIVATVPSPGRQQTFPGISQEFLVPRSYPLGDLPAAAATGDLDDDGDMDVVVANYFDDSVSVRLNNGDGTFTNPPTPLLGFVAELHSGDFNNDGLADFAGPFSGNQIKVMMNAGNDEFALPQLVTAARSEIERLLSFTIADVTGDGIDDIITTYNRIFRNNGQTRSFDDLVAITPSNGDGTFGRPIEFRVGDNPIAVVVADFDGNNRPDLAIANSKQDINTAVPPNLDLTNGISVVLQNLDGTFAAPVELDVEGVPRDIAAIDVNRDGRPDLALTYSPEHPQFGTISNHNLAIYVNQNGSSFAPAAGHSVGTSLGELVVGEFTGDVDDDLVVINAINTFDDELLLLQGNGAGSFAAPASIAQASAIHNLLAGHFDSDGDLDLATARGGNAYVLLNEGSGVFGGPLTPFPAQTVGTKPLTAGDFDGDGDIDLASNSNQHVRLLKNDGDARFFRPGEVAVGDDPSSVALGDLDNDGDLDLITTGYDYDSSSGFLSIALNRGDGTFELEFRVPVGKLPSDVRAAHLDGDSLLDLAVFDTDGSVWLLFNEGGASFAAPVEHFVHSDLGSFALGDLDEDGDLDIAVTQFDYYNASNSGVALLINQGARTFTPAPVLTLPGLSGAVDAGDFDNDGDVDLAVGNIDLGEEAEIGAGGIELLENLGGATFESMGRLPANDFQVLLRAADVDQDGDDDLTLVSRLPDAVRVYVNEGGSFRPDQELQFPFIFEFAIPAPLRSAAGMDLLVLDRSADALVVAPNTGGARFASVARTDVPDSDTTAGNLTVGDFDGDGDADIGVDISVYDSSLALLFNGQGGKAFNVLPKAFTGSFFGDEPNAVGDVDGDGDLDILTVDGDHYGTNVSVWINTGGGVFAPPGPANTATVELSNVQLRVVDLNHDGAADVIATGSSVIDGSFDAVLSSGSTVLLSDGAGGLTALTGSAPRIIRSGDFVADDFDGDGDVDVITVETDTDELLLFRSNGDGTFAPEVSIGVGDKPEYVTAADLDGDGDLDLAVANDLTDDVSVLINNGNGAFNLTASLASPFGPLAVTAADLDGDGDLDLASANGYDLAGHVVVFINNGNATFQNGLFVPAMRFLNDIAAGDFDDDGDNDLVVVDDRYMQVLLNDGNAVFVAQPQEFVVSFDLRRVEVGHLDGDGDLDLIFTTDDFYGNTGGETFFNYGDATFTPFDSGFSRFEFPSAAAVADVNNDGNPDFIAAVDDTHLVAIHRNLGDGFFGAPRLVDVGLRAHFAAGGDFDGDGDVDVVVAALDLSRLVLLENQGGEFVVAEQIDFFDFIESLTPIDLNNDGRSDLIVEQQQSDLATVLFGAAGGGFDSPFYISAESLAVGDISGNGNMDLAASTNDGAAVMLNGAPPSLRHAVNVRPGAVVTGVEFGEVSIGPVWQNPDNPLDVTGDGIIAPDDALFIINRLLFNGAGPLPVPPTPQFHPPPFYDTTGDDFLAPDDALRVINALIVPSPPQSVEGEGEPPPTAGKLFNDPGLAVAESIREFQASPTAVDAYHYRAYAHSPLDALPPTAGEWRHAAADRVLALVGDWQSRPAAPLGRRSLDHDQFSPLDESLEKLLAERDDFPSRLLRDAIRDGWVQR